MPFKNPADKAAWRKRDAAKRKRKAETTEKVIAKLFNRSARKAAAALPKAPA